MIENLTNYKMIDEYCNIKLPTNYEIHWLIAFISLSFVGLFYIIFGYRWWRLSIFIPSFGLSLIFLYMILSIQPALSEPLLVSISCLLAILFGLISALLQHIGLFIIGFCFGLIISIIIFLIWNIIDYTNGITTSFWLLFGLILIIGLLCAILTLRFQKFMIIIISSCIGGVCQIFVLDYFLQLSILLHFIYKRILFELTPLLCIHHWIIVFILPVIMLFGIVIQYSCTGKHYDHRDSWHKFINTGKNRYTMDFKKIRRQYEKDLLRQENNSDECNRFRYFYHIRRANGDALSSDFIQNVRQQSSTAVRLTSINNNITPITTIETTPTQKETDSTTTTLTNLI